MSEKTNKSEAASPSGDQEVADLVEHMIAGELFCYFGAHWTAEKMSGGACDACKEAEFNLRIRKMGAAMAAIIDDEIREIIRK